MEMPKLTMDRQVEEQRKVIKFWIEYCRKLEKDNEKLKEELMKYRGH